MRDNSDSNSTSVPNKEFGVKAGFLLMGAAALSLLFPRLGRNLAQTPEPQRPHGAQAMSGPQKLPGQQAAPQVGASANAAPRPLPARAPKRMWALVQFSPEVIVLAVSPSRAELERELAELNETWNHWELRTERQRYAIQAAPVLYAGQEPAAVRPIGSAATG